jgi:hypothetical protein
MVETNHTGWLDLLTPSFTTTLNFNQLQQLTITDCLRLATFFTGLRLSSFLVFLLLWLSSDLRITHFWFTNGECRMTEFLFTRPLLWSSGNNGKCWLLVRIRGNLCWILVYTETPSVLSWSLGNHHLHVSMETCVNFVASLWFPKSTYFIFVSVDTFIKHPAMVCVQEIVSPRQHVSQFVS